jgi:hypothetical protein
LNSHPPSQRNNKHCNKLNLATNSFFILIMFSVAIRRAVSFKTSKITAAPTRFVRSFSGHVVDIPSDKEQQTGRRKMEIDAEEQGLPGFNRDPIIPSDDMGTKENPILVNLLNHK